MPTADEGFNEVQIPSHRNMKLESVSVQNFNKCKFIDFHKSASQLTNDDWEGSRRLLAYSRNEENIDAVIAEEVSNRIETQEHQDRETGMLSRTADALNPFRKKVTPK